MVSLGPTVLNLNPNFEIQNTDLIGLPLIGVHRKSLCLGGHFNLVPQCLDW